MIWFVDSAAGSDSNVGWRADAPFATLAKLATVMVSGDEAYLSGTFRESVTFSSLDGCTWRRWPGMPKYSVRGDTVVSGWTSLGSGVYQKNIGASLSVKSVVVDWDTSINAYGLHYGHLVQGTFGGLTAGTWAYTSPNLQIRLLDGSDPASKTVAWCKGGVNGMSLVSCTNCVVDDFRGYLWCDSAPNTGYALHMTGCINVRVGWDESADCGYHHTGFPGGACSYNIIERSYNGLGRMGGNASGGICVAVYTTSANQTGNIVRDMTMYATPFLTTAAGGNTPVSTSQNFGGVITHTDGVVSWPAGGVTVERVNVIYPYQNGAGIGAFSGANSATPTPNTSNELDPANYGTVFRDCRSWGTYNAGLVCDGSAAFIRCSFKDISQAKCQVGAVAHALNSTTATLLMDSCEIIADCGGASSGRIFFPYTNRRLVLLNVSAIDVGTGSNERRVFFPLANSATVRAHQCIFGSTVASGSVVFFYANGGFSNAANGAGLVPRVFEDCAYLRISANVYDANASHNTSAEWTSTIDAGAQHIATTPFEEPATGQPVNHLRLSRSHALWTYRDTGTTAHTARGINHKPWTGTLGCYQYNASATANWPTMTSTKPTPVGRPMMKIGFYTNAGTNDAKIYNAMWLDPEATIEASLAKAKVAGIRTVLLFVPFGHDGADYYRFANAEECPHQIVSVLQQNVENWKRKYNIDKFGIFVGSAWPTRNTGGTGGTKPLPYPDWENESVSYVLDSWRDAGCDFAVFDRTANQSTDIYSGSVNTQFDSLGGFSDAVVGMVPMGEAIPFDVADIDPALVNTCEWFVLQSYYDAAGGGTQAALDATLPTPRKGLHWIFGAENYTLVDAQARLDQGYIVGVGDDLSQENINAVANLVPTTGSAGASGTVSGEAGVDPNVPPAPTPLNPSNARTMGRGRVGRARRPALSAGVT